MDQPGNSIDFARNWMQMGANQSEFANEYEYEYNYDDETEFPKIDAIRGEEGAPAAKKSKKCSETFSEHEILHIFKFLVDQITSKSAERRGRVAKKRVETSTMDLWVKYKLMFDLPRRAPAYRANFRANVDRVHTLAGLSLQEKADLYYGLELKVTAAAFREQLAELGCVFDSRGVLRSSGLLGGHWDERHPETDREEDRDAELKKGQQKFAEADDGLMWQYVLDLMNAAAPRALIPISGVKAWQQFKCAFQSRGINMNRSPETYRVRYNQILIPNLYRMPFDAVTKAAIFHRFKYVVPKEYRQTLIEATGVSIDETGRVAEFAASPAHLVLQSEPPSQQQQQSAIGIASRQKTSTLKYPNSGGAVADIVPYSEEEERRIWHFIRHSFQDARGKPMRATRKVTGWLFWRHFIKETASKRTWQSLSDHFSEMLENLMETPFDVRTKIELLFCLQHPIDAKTEEIVKKMTKVCILKEDRRIRYAAGTDRFHRFFEVGRRDSYLDGQMMMPQQRPSLPFQRPPVSGFSTPIPAAAQQSSGASNSVKYPYMRAQIRAPRQPRPSEIRARISNNRQEEDVETEATTSSRPAAHVLIREIKTEEEDGGGGEPWWRPAEQKPDVGLLIGGGLLTHHVLHEDEVKKEPLSEEEPEEPEPNETN